jgi:hypothetical protein
VAMANKINAKNNGCCSSGDKGSRELEKLFREHKDVFEPVRERDATVGVARVGTVVRKSPLVRRIQMRMRMKRKLSSILLIPLTKRVAVLARIPLE